MVMTTRNSGGVPNNPFREQQRKHRKSSSSTRSPFKSTLWTIGVGSVLCGVAFYRNSNDANSVLTPPNDVLYLRTTATTESVDQWGTANSETNTGHATIITTNVPVQQPTHSVSHDTLLSGLATKPLSQPNENENDDAVVASYAAGVVTHDDDDDTSTETQADDDAAQQAQYTADKATDDTALNDDEANGGETEDPVMPIDEGQVVTVQDVSAVISDPGLSANATDEVGYGSDTNESEALPSEATTNEDLLTIAQESGSVSIENTTSAMDNTTATGNDDTVVIADENVTVAIANLTWTNDTIIEYVDSNATTIHDAVDVLDQAIPLLDYNTTEANTTITMEHGNDDQSAIESSAHAFDEKILQNTFMRSVKTEVVATQGGGNESSR